MPVYFSEIFCFWQRVAVSFIDTSTVLNYHLQFKTHRIQFVTSRYFLKELCNVNCLILGPPYNGDKGILVQTQ